MLETANMTVYETIYGLGNTLPGAASSGNCAGYNQNAGPRNTALGQFEGDDSGGIRKLPGTVYNGNTYSGYSGEDWGPGSNWACLSWKTHLATFQETHQPKMTTSGTRTQQRSSSLFPMKDQKTAIHLNKPMT